MLEYRELYSDNIKNQNMNLLTDVIYNNFIDLSSNKKLLHEKDKIYETLTSNDVFLLLVVENNKLVAYVLASIMMLNDNRKVLYISYIYVAKTHRNRGIASQCIKKIEIAAKKNRCDGIMLIFNTKDSKLFHFYETRGFMLDINLRRYEMHDVYYKSL